jgi:hypothetical protein
MRGYLPPPQNACCAFLARNCSHPPNVRCRAIYVRCASRSRHSRRLSAWRLVDLARFQWTVQKDPPDRSSKSAGLMLPRYLGAIRMDREPPAAP